MNKRMHSGKTYEKLFICLLGFLILYWIAAIFFKGADSPQFNLFFDKMQDFLADATNVVGYSSQRDPYNCTFYSVLGQKAYPPLVYMIMYFFSRLVDMNPYYEADYFKNMYEEPLFILAYSVFTGLVLLTGYELIKKGKTGSDFVKTGTAITLLLSGPMIYSIERGNVIIWVPFLCLSFLMFYDSKNKALKEIGLISLAVAAGIKLLPAIFGLVLLIEKRWKEAIRTIIYGIIAVFLPFVFFKGGFANIPLMLRNMGYLMEELNTLDGCSIRSILKIVGDLLSVSITEKQIVAITAIVGAILITTAVFSKFTWERILAISLIIIMIPSSGYYYAIYLIPSSIMFLNEEAHKPEESLVFLALLLIFNPVQSILQTCYIDYHLGFVILLFVMTMRCFVYVIQHVKGNNFFNYQEYK